MERYGINRLTEATELLYSRNGMSATQKYEAIQGIFTQLADHSKPAVAVGYVRSARLWMTG